MKAYFDSGVTRLYHGDARALPLADESVHCVVTSPPYWGLRDYNLEPSVWGGDEGCEHEWGTEISNGVRDRQHLKELGDRDGSHGGAKHSRGDQYGGNSGAFCRLCPAWCGTLGLEPTPELYVQHIVEVFREVWRVLRKDGTLWLNMGDSYANNPASAVNRNSLTGTLNQGRADFQVRQANLGHRQPMQHGLKPKDLVMMPARVAMALQADGWWLRSDIIWSKPNPMPESVTDRPTTSHEHLFLLTKAPRYYYDAVAIREQAIHHGRLVKATGSSSKNALSPDEVNDRRTATGFTEHDTLVTGRNRRSVWEIATQPYPDAHFATFPEALVEPCILAGTSEWGCCAKCGAPYERVVERERSFESGSGRSGNLPAGKNGPLLQGGGETVDIRRGPVVHTTTTGWQKACHHLSAVVPAIVLDPFAGSATTSIVAQKLGRHSVGVDLSAAYLDLAVKRLSAIPLPMVLSE